MAEYRWTKTHQAHGHPPYTETAVIDVEDGCVVVTYDLLVDMLVSLGFVEEVA